MVWYAKDNEFEKPKSIASANLYTSDIEFNKTPKSKIFTQIWEKIINEYLREFKYQAEMAGLEGDISFTDTHITFTFNGYSSNLTDFIVEIFKKIQSFNPKEYEKEFISIKNKWLRDRQNYYFNKPIAQCYSSLMNVITKGRFDDKELLAHEGELTFDVFCDLSTSFLKSGYLNWLIVGNLNSEQALNMAEKGCKAFKLQACDLSALTTIPLYKL